MVIDWSTATDFDNNQQETGYHHDQPTGTDWSAADVLERGYSADVQSVGPPTLAYYPWSG